MNIKYTIKPLQRKLKMLERKTGECAYESTVMALEHIHRKAMENLNENLQWGHSSDEAMRIEQSKDIIVEKIGKITRGRLVYNSPHAELIEYGGFVNYTRPPGTTPMPIGKNQGYPKEDLYYTYSLNHFVQGKYFLTRAFMSEKDSVMSIYNDIYHSLD